MITADKIFFIDVDGDKQWETYISLFPIHLQPHRSPSQLDCIKGLKEEVLLLLKAIRDKEKEIATNTSKGFQMWVTEAIREGDEYLIKQRLLNYVKCSKKYKVYNDWGYRKDKWYYTDNIPEGWNSEKEAGVVVYRRISNEKPNTEKIKKELNQLK